MSKALGSVNLLPTSGGVISLPGITPSSTSAVNDALTENHRNHHIYFNDGGFHNHIVHYLLALYDLGAPASLISTGYNREKQYQRPLSDKFISSEEVDLTDPSKWGPYLEKGQYYTHWLQYFQKEIQEHGVEEVVNKLLFSGTEMADDMLVRLFAGFIHPFIHLGYGLEFKQPTIVAEGLAHVATHEKWMGDIFLKAEKAAKEVGDTSAKTLVELLGEIRTNEKLRNAPRWSDGNKIKGIIERAPEEMIAVARQYKVPVDQLEKKMAESVNAAALFTAAAQREDKQIKIDFYYMHAHNSSIFLKTFLAQPWISDENKARLLEWKGRHDLALYASRRAPDLRVDDIRNYVSKARTDTNPWLDVIDRAMKIDDDGHFIKLVRAAANGEKVCAEYQDHEDEGFVVRGDMWVKIAQMAVDSLEEGGDEWVRSTGFDEAWENYGPRVNYG